jgi:hypothetical protein
VVAHRQDDANHDAEKPFTVLRRPDRPVQLASGMAT